MTATGRARRTAEADALCEKAYAAAGGADVGCALIAVGGYGRGELAPHSDLDVVLAHDAEAPGAWAEQLWYPLWDSGVRLDHAVRSFAHMVEAAEGDLRVALGLLDLRHLSGDPNLTLRLRTTMLASWRRQARQRLPELSRLVRSRHELIGELAHASVPDLKEAEGGLRDATVLKALVASWLVDVPHVDLERSRLALLDVRDVLHHATGRPSDRIAPELWDELARGLGLDSATAAQTHVRELGRRITHLSRITWRRVDAVLDRPASVTGARRPVLTPLAPGVALSSGEVVLDAKAKPGGDPVMLVRAAAEAAERNVVLAPATAARLVRECPPLPTPWPREARQQFVRLLAAGPGLLGVWETLEETGALSRILPEWERIHLLPHASVIHRFTVDRHSVETCVEAASLIRHVGRPDVLMVAALLHDIGKGGVTEHSVAGEPVARQIATRMGFADDAIELITTLVRWHLLLARVATTRDPDDPATVGEVVDKVSSHEALSLLAALTEADAKATAPQAWSTWRAILIRGLARRCLTAVETSPGVLPAETAAEPVVSIPAGLADDPRAVVVSLDTTPDGARLTAVGGDRVGLLADVAASLALQRISVRAARAWSQDDYGISAWDIDDDHLDLPVLARRLERIVTGELQPRDRLQRASATALAPAVVLHPDASAQATVLEVRAADRPGLLYVVLAAVADLGISVRSAHVDTLGPQAVDVFYLQEEGAGALSEERAAAAAHAVRAALTPADPGA